MRFYYTFFCSVSSIPCSKCAQFVYLIRTVVLVLLTHCQFQKFANNSFLCAGWHVPKTHSLVIILSNAHLSFFPIEIEIKGVFLYFKFFVV